MKTKTTKIRVILTRKKKNTKKTKDFEEEKKVE